jgi:uncharacterized protein (TIGR02594 family)
MKKTFIALTAASPLFMAVSAEAAPQKKKQVSQQTALQRCNLSVQERYAHYARFCSMLKPETIARRNPAPAPAEVAHSYRADDDSAAAFFAADRARMANLQVTYNTTQTAKTRKTNDTPARRNKTPLAPEPVRVAQQWEGYHAQRNRSELRDLLSKGNEMVVDPVRIPWCAAFANAILKQTGYEGTGSLTARSFLGYGVATKYPKEGDIVVFTRGRSQYAGHVGFYMGEETLNGVRYIKVLGGNQNKEVNVAYYPANRLLGYRRLG